MYGVYFFIMTKYNLICLYLKSDYICFGPRNISYDNKSDLTISIRGWTLVGMIYNFVKLFDLLFVRETEEIGN